MECSVPNEPAAACPHCIGHINPLYLPKTAPNGGAVLSVTIELMLYYEKSTHATLEDLQTTERGLSNSEAAERLAVHGPNTIRVRGTPLWRKLVEPFANVFMAVLFLAAVISLFH